MLLVVNIYTFLYRCSIQLRSFICEINKYASSIEMLYFSLLFNFIFKRNRILELKSPKVDLLLFTKNLKTDNYLEKKNKKKSSLKNYFITF